MRVELRIVPLFVALTLDCALSLHPACGGENFQQMQQQQFNIPYQPSGAPNSRQAQMYFQQAIAMFNAHQYTETIKFCKMAMSKEYGNKKMCHLLAMAYSKAGDAYNANMQFRSALTFDPSYTECRNNYGLFLRETGKLKEAKREFEVCIEKEPNYAKAYYNLGAIYKEQGQLDKAIDNFETATRLDPNHWEAQRDLGLAMYERTQETSYGALGACVEKLQTAARLVPDNPLIWYQLGIIYCNEGKLDDAEGAFRNALMRDPKLAAAHWQLGKLRYYRGDTNRCLSEVLIATRVSPSYTEGKDYPKVDPVSMRTCIANCLEAQGKMIDAVTAWKDVASMRRDSAVVYQHIDAMEKELRAAARKKKKGKAGSAFDPEEIDALVKKGINLAEDGEIEGAKKAYLRALELNPDSFEALQNLGALLEGSGDLNGAMEKYRAAMRLEPQFDGAYYNCAYLLEKMHLPAEAGMMYQRFHELAGKYPYDSRHIVLLQQQDARERARLIEEKQRGY